MSVQQTSAGAVASVELDEYVIRMPRTVPAGHVTFKVANVGSHRHTIAVRGEGVRSRLSPDLEAGQSADWVLDLPPGTYQVWCPVGPHSTLGMHTTLTAERR
jgi:uncharacterized cupredoxin-like copper-binding protein